MISAPRQRPIRSLHEYMPGTAVGQGLGFAVMFQGAILQLETYELPHDHEISGTFEMEIVQTAMDSMMVDRKVTSVTASAHSTNSWIDNPTGTGTSPLYPTYLRVSNTTWFYCWDSSGNVTRQDKYSEAC